MSILKFLGTAASIPTKKRDNTSFLFKHKNSSFLIDCPGSISQKLLKVGEDYKKIKKIIITHHHPDHIYGIISLIHTQMPFNKNITIFSSKPSFAVIKNLIKIFKLNKKKIPKIKYIDVFSRKYFFTHAHLKIKALKNKHIKESFALLFSFGKKKLVYSSDTGFTPLLFKNLGKINYLIHDCTASSQFFQKNPSLYKMHTCASQLTAYLKTKPETTLIPIHFLLANKKEEAKIKKELAPLKRKVIFVKDFQKVSL